MGSVDPENDLLPHPVLILETTGHITMKYVFYTILVQLGIFPMDKPYHHHLHDTCIYAGTWCSATKRRYICI